MILVIFVVDLEENWVPVLLLINEDILFIIVLSFTANLIFIRLDFIWLVVVKLDRVDVMCLSASFSASSGEIGVNSVIKGCGV